MRHAPTRALRAPTARSLVLACGVVLAVAAPVTGHPAIGVVELNGAAERKFADVTDPNVRIPLTFEERCGKPVANIRIDCTRFVSASGDGVMPTLADGEVTGERLTIDFPARGRRPLELRAFLPIPATYRTTLRILQGDSVLGTFAIEVARVKGSLPIDVLDVPAVQAEAVPFRGVATVSLRLNAYALDGRRVIKAPILHGATRKEKADSAAGRSTDLELKEPGRDQDIVVDWGPPSTIPVVLVKFAGPGRYDGVLRFAAPGYQPIDRTVTVYVRDHGWVAFVCIFLGVMLSLGVHAYGKVLRPRYLAGQIVARLLADTRAALSDAADDAEARSLIQRVDTTIKTLWDRALAQRRPITTEFDVFEQLVVPALPSWTKLHRQLLGLRPREVRDKLMPTLTAAATEFGRPAPDQTKVQASIDAMEKLPAAMHSELLAALTTEVKKLEKNLASDPRTAAVDILGLLLVVRAKLDGDQLEAAIGAFDAARLRYVALLAADLRRRVEPQAPPSGVEDAQWQTLRESTRQRLDEIAKIASPEEAMSALRAAGIEYLRAVGAALRRAAAKLDETPRTDIDSKIKAMETSIPDDLPAAWTALDTAQAGYAAARAKATGAPMGVEALSPVAATAAFDVVQAIDVGPRAQELARPGAAVWLARRLSFADYLASAIVILVAGALGVQVLWIDNPTWGGWTSYLAAFVWGFALDQFTHAGVTAVRPR